MKGYDPDCWFSNPPLKRGGRHATGRRIAGSLQPSVAVTGGVACGKSALGLLLAERGADVLDADSVVHRLQAPDGELCKAVRRVFGDRFLSADGGVDRERLGRLVFSDPNALRLLNRLSHPLVRERFDRWRMAPSEGWAKVGLIPLLVECGWDADWDWVVCVTCSPDRQMRRLRDRGLTEEDALGRITAQASTVEKVRAADWIVENDGDWPALAAAADAIRGRVVEMSGR